MSHFLKQMVKSFKNIQSLTSALISLKGPQYIISQRGQSLSIYGGQHKKVDLLCKRKGFGTLYDFGYTEDNNELHLHCDGMDRTTIERVEQQAQQAQMQVETTQELLNYGFSPQEQTVGDQGQTRVVYSRWR